MITSASFTDTQSIALEKERLRQAIAQQEQVVIKSIERAKNNTVQELSPANLLKNSIGTLLSVSMLRKNPITSFRLGYKIVSFLLKRIRKK